MSVFPQIGLVAYLAIIQKPLLPIDRAFGIVGILFIIVEVFLGYKAASRVVKAKTARFAVEYSSEVGEEDVDESKSALELRPLVLSEKKRRGSGSSPLQTTTLGYTRESKRD